jgi:hypothetical protein
MTIKQLCCSHYPVTDSLNFKESDSVIAGSKTPDRFTTLQEWLNLDHSSQTTFAIIAPHILMSLSILLE